METEGKQRGICLSLCTAYSALNIVEKREKREREKKRKRKRKRKEGREKSGEEKKLKSSDATEYI